MKNLEEVLGKNSKELIQWLSILYYYMLYLF